jgi:pimeloyl-ACP methyl ester carboxylesterase
MPAQEPAWLARALETVPHERDVEVNGIPIHYLEWGAEGAPGVVLVHGGLCHAHWWDHIAPLLLDRHVLAIDLSGHGDSGRRVSYDAHQWAREIRAVAVDAGVRDPVVIGHSMGGQSAVAAAVHFPEIFAGVITIDTRFNDESYTPRNKPSRVFPSLADGIAEFRPVRTDAESDPVPAFLTWHVAATSLRPAGNGWRWKRDDEYNIRHVPLRELLPDLAVPLAVVRTERGVVTQAMAAEMRRVVEVPAVDVEIPNAGHNPMLEQPLALVSVLRTLLGAWFPLAVPSKPTTSTESETHDR